MHLKKKYNANSNILLIDFINVQNKNGSKNITINPKYKKKKGTKLSIITNTMGFIFSILFFKINKTLKNKSKTSIHNVKMLKHFKI